MFPHSGKNSGQAGLELIVTVMFLLLIFVILVAYAVEKNREANEIKMFLDAMRIANSAADNVNMIAQQGDGYYKYFTLPESLFGGEEYNITTYENVVEISWGSYRWATQVVTANITGNFSKGTNKVTNMGGVIYIG